MRGLSLEPDLIDTLRAQLPEVAGRTVQAVTAEVPDYGDAFSSEMGVTLTGAVQMALAGFLRLASHPADDAMSPLGPAREGAYALGRGEARSGRTMHALLSAYRVGARVAWREMSATAVAEGMPGTTVAEFAELVFAYIDELSAASVAGHSDELATSGRVREQYRERLARALLEGQPAELLEAAAGRADWAPPSTLTAVLVPSARTRDTLALLDPRTLVVPGELVDVPDHDVLLVPDVRREGLLRDLRQRTAVVGPTRRWTSVRPSYQRAVRALELGDSDGPVDTDEHLSSLVLSADPLALADLRTQALAPLSGLRAATAERLAETLRCWLLHQGRREDVARELHVHAQTVRYRMTQLRELYGEDLTDPECVLRLTIALAVPGSAHDEPSGATARRPG